MGIGDLRMLSEVAACLSLNLSSAAADRRGVFQKEIRLALATAC